MSTDQIISGAVLACLVIGLAWGGVSEVRSHHRFTLRRFNVMNVITGGAWGLLSGCALVVVGVLVAKLAGVQL